MKRLFYLVTDLNKVKKITDELEEKGIKKTNIHVVGKKSDAIEKAHLHEANLIQKSDLVPSLKRGGSMGIFLFLILSGVYIYVLPETVKINFYSLIPIFIFGIILGAWGSSLMGVSVKDPIVKKFEKFIKKGHYIIVVDSSNEQETKCIDSVINNHPDVKLAGAE